jgi:hypothetical protein
LEQKNDLPTALRFACAAGLTNVEHVEKQMPHLANITANIERISVRKNNVNCAALFSQI